MTSPYTIKEHVRKLESISSHEELLYTILIVFMELFPVSKAYLCRYSHFGYIGEGVISLSSAGVKNISELRDDIRSSPIIYSAIHERTAKYCSGIDFFLQHSNRFIISEKINSLVIVPICLGSVVLGYICANEFKKGTTIDDSLLLSFTLFGKLVGKVMGSSICIQDLHLLSKRELEVMRGIAWGDSSKEIAEKMQISELTVNQYAKSAIKKLGAQNRAQAVAELFRKGLVF